jgi:ADP-ribosylglycohydrolase
MAYRDAMLTHTKNGIYGELLVSAMISTAFVTDSITDIVDAGIAVVPQQSRLAEALRDTITWSQKYSSWEDAWSRLIEKYRQYHWAHAITNAAIILLGILYGKGDFDRSLAVTVMAGQDTDSTGATVGSLLGVLVGARSIPDKWTKPLNDRLESYIAGYGDSRISDLAKRTMQITLKTNKVV